MAGRMIAMGGMCLVGRRGDLLRQLAGEDLVDRVQHLAGGAEGEEKRAGDEGRFCVPRLLREEVAHLRELPRRRPLKGEDRLLVVTDGEDGARLLRRAFAGEEILGDLLHHRPLVGARVLRLVDKDVLDAAVELVEHPGGGVRARQEIARLGDQVGEVERAGAPLGGVIGAEDRVADDEQRLRRRVGAHEREPLGERKKTRGLLRERLLEAALRLSEGGAEAMRLAAAFPACAVGRQEEPEPGVGFGGSGGSGRDRVER